MGDGGIRVKMEISVTKVYGPTILTLPGGGGVEGVKFPEKSIMQHLKSNGHLCKKNLNGINL